MMEVMGVYGDSAKVVECQQSFEEIKRTFNDSNLSKTAKTVEIVAQGTFITTQTAEFALRKNPDIAPFINTVNGVADVVKIGVHGCVREESWKEIASKIGRKALSHGGEALTNLAFSPGFRDVPIIRNVGITLSVISLAINTYILLKPSRNQYLVRRNPENIELI